MRSYPKIKPELLQQLLKVEPSVDLKTEYRPCKVYLTDGSALDRVYVMEKSMYKGTWGVWPEDDPGKRWVSIEEIIRIEESPFRLPAKVANKIYDGGESGMGYCLFTLVLKDGRTLPYVTGNAVDFVDLPPGATVDMVKDVLPHAGREHFQTKQIKPYTRGLPNHWCLYENERTLEGVS